jgi:putative DNA primase/helicase
MAKTKSRPVALEPSRAMISAHLNAVYRHASDATYLSLRAFDDRERDRPPLFVEAVRIDAPNLVDRIRARAAEAANTPSTAVFCPPVCTFKVANGAKLEDMAEGLVTVAELDERPSEMRAKLTALLGRPTEIVRSGGEWLNPVTGNLEPKLHLFWRLAVPTRTEAEHAQLREANELVAVVAGSDRSAISPVHPFRWPGSWHRKNPERPRLAQIVDDSGVDPEAELDLTAVLAKLREACPRETRSRATGGTPQAPIEDIEAALAVIPGTDDRAEWIDTGLAVFAASGGSEQGLAAYDAWSRKAPTKYGGVERAWASFAGSPPTRIGFGTLFHKARQADPSFRPPSWEVISNPFSEDGMALLLAERYADRARYVPMWGRWLLWNGSVWQPDERLEAFTGARVVCRDTAKLAKKEGGAKFSSAKTVAAVVTMAKADERLVTAPGQWDADDWGLGGPTFVDLRTGIARAPRPDDYNTKATGAAAAPPGTAHPIWTAFLNRITNGDADLVGFLQRFCGYCLTGVTTEQVLAFLYGTGANGKSVFVGTVSGIMGGHVAVAPMETLLASKMERHPTDIAKLMGARLVTAHEIAGGRRWDEEKIKLLTGGDKVTARFMRQDYFDFVPKFKLMVFGNHKPTLRSVDEAIRRRLLLVPFTVTIPERERDPDLPEKLRAEWPAILRWAIDGCLEWQRQGLRVPVAVREASKAYFDAQNTLGEWIEEALDCNDPRSWTSTVELFDAWKQWCDPRSLPHGSTKSFSEAMEERGFAKKLHDRTRRAGFCGVTFAHPLKS